MTQQVIEQKKRTIVCRYCNQCEIEFDVNRKNKAGTKLLPIEVASGIIHSCSQSPWNLNKDKVNAKATTATAINTPTQTELLNKILFEVRELQSQLAELTDKVV